VLLSYRWVAELAGFAPNPEDLAEKLTFSGLEIDGLKRVGVGLDRVIVGIIKDKRPHPSKQNLNCVSVDTGNGDVPVVCGAPNCPGAGSRVVLAQIGARLGDLEIAPRELSKERSEGMLCSERELGIGPDHDGILLLDGITNAAAGTPITQALDLDDWIYDVSVTPNRPDALSHRGIAREMALLYGQPFTPPAIAQVEENGAPISELAQVVVRDTIGCPRYAASLINGIEVGQSRFSARYRLHNLGVRPICNAVDVSNLIMLEWGQPLHAFDLDKISNNRIEVRRAVDGERMKTLDDIDRLFTSDDLLICDGERPIGIAGIMGGLDTGVTETTRNVLIECAYFDPKSIRRTSKRLRLQSESSYRFERGVDPSATLEALEAATSSMIAACGGEKAPGMIDCCQSPIQRRRILFRTKRFGSTMGYTAERTEMKRVLEGIGARVSQTGEDFSVEAPLSRPDIEREIDLIEEVARVLGLERVPSQLPRIQSRAPQRLEFDAARRVKETLASYGLDEATCYSFVPGGLLTKLAADDDVVRIANPLNTERASMRTTLLAGLLENLRRATTRYELSLRQFEVGHTFHDEGKELPREVLRAAVLLSGPRDAWVGEKSAEHDFFDVKGIASALVRDLTGCTAEFCPLTEARHLHPLRASSIRIDSDTIGTIGEIHPDILASLKLPRGAVCFEVDVLSLWSKRRRPRVPLLSEFPPVVRDVSLLIPEKQDAGPIAESLQKACGPLAVQVRLIDIYRGQGVEDGKKSLTYSITYRAFDRTLTDAEIDSIHKNAVDSLSQQFSAVVR